MRFTFLLSLVIFSGGHLFAQDAIFSQPNAMPLYANPSMAGSKGGIRLIKATRLQWLKQDGGYITNYFSYDQYSRHLRSGFGYEEHHVIESKGMFESWQRKVSFSPSISVGRRLGDSLRQIVIKPGIYIGVVQYAVNWSSLTWGDMIDPMFGYIYNTNEVKNRNVVAAPDFGASTLVYGRKFYAGFSVSHLTEPEMGFLFGGSPLPMRIVLQGGFLLKEYKWLGDFTLCPSFVYERQDSWNRIELAFTGTYKGFIFGVTERFTSAMVLQAGYQYRFFKIGYSYDLATTKAAMAFGATHEIVLAFNFANRKEYKKIRTLDFPAL